MAYYYKIDATTKTIELSDHFPEELAKNVRHMDDHGFHSDEVFIRYKKTSKSNGGTSSWKFYVPLYAHKGADLWNGTLKPLEYEGIGDGYITGPLLHNKKEGWSLQRIWVTEKELQEVVEMIKFE